MAAPDPKRMQKCRCKECKRINAQIRKIRQERLTGYLRIERSVK